MMVRPDRRLAGSAKAAWRAVAVALAHVWPTSAWAQGGNIGEGPGWTALFLMLWLAASAAVGTVALVGILTLRSRFAGRPRARAAIVAAYLLAFPATAAAGLVALFTEWWWPAALLLAAGIAAFLLVLRQRWRVD